MAKIDSYLSWKSFMICWWRPSCLATSRSTISCTSWLSARTRPSTAFLLMRKIVPVTFLFWRKPHKNSFLLITTELKYNTENKQGRLRLGKTEIDYEWQKIGQVFPWHSSFKMVVALYKLRKAYLTINYDNNNGSRLVVVVAAALVYSFMGEQLDKYLCSCSLLASNSCSWCTWPFSCLTECFDSSHSFVKAPTLICSCCNWETYKRWQNGETLQLNPFQLIRLPTGH